MHYVNYGPPDPNYYKKLYDYEKTYFYERSTHKLHFSINSDVIALLKEQRGDIFFDRANKIVCSLPRFAELVNDKQFTFDLPFKYSKVVIDNYHKITNLISKHVIKNVLVTTWGQTINLDDKYWCNHLDYTPTLIPPSDGSEIATIQVKLPPLKNDFDKEWTDIFTEIHITLQPLEHIYNNLKEAPHTISQDSSASSCYSDK